MTATVAILLLGWGCSLVLGGYACWRWARCIAQLRALTDENLYLRDELVGAHGTTDWEW